MKKKFDIVFTKQFLKEIRNLDRPTQIRVLRELRILEEQPLLGKRLAGQLIGLMSFRIGDYRVIYQVSKKTLIIRTIGHRSTVYEK